MYKVVEVIERTHIVEELSENKARQVVMEGILEPISSDCYIKSLVELVEAPNEWDDNN